jgi:hypothetical protein
MTVKTQRKTQQKTQIWNLTQDMELATGNLLLACVIDDSVVARGGSASEPRVVCALAAWGFSTVFRFNSGRRQVPRYMARVE